MQTIDPKRLGEHLSLPAIAAPMTDVSGLEWVIACCVEGILGTFPSGNAREDGGLASWLEKIEAALASHRRGNPVAIVAPYGVNLIIRSPLLEEDLSTVEQHRVPVVIPSVGSPAPVVERVHAYGGIVLADVATVLHAHKALAAGVDGLILLCAGAGGNTGWLNPFAFTSAVREFYDGPLVLAGGISNGRSIRAARSLGADLAYLGTTLIPTVESLAPDSYRNMLLESTADDVILTRSKTGLVTNRLRSSLEAIEFFEEHKREKNPFYTNNIDTSGDAWNSVWSAGHGVGEVKEIATVKAVVDRLKYEYAAAGAEEPLAQPRTGSA